LGEVFGRVFVVSILWHSAPRTPHSAVH
jgi:hypothetical protein